jgi:hypothetical protein
MLTAKPSAASKSSAKTRTKPAAKTSPAYPLPPAEGRVQGVEQTVAVYATHSQRAHEERAFFHPSSSSTPPRMTWMWSIGCTTVCRSRWWIGCSWRA